MPIAFVQRLQAPSLSNIGGVSGPQTYSFNGSGNVTPGAGNTTIWTGFIYTSGGGNTYSAISVSDNGGGGTYDTRILLNNGDALLIAAICYADNGATRRPSFSFTSAAGCTTLGYAIIEFSGLPLGISAPDLSAAGTGVALSGTTVETIASPGSANFANEAFYSFAMSTYPGSSIAFSIAGFNNNNATANGMSTGGAVQDNYDTPGTLAQGAGRSLTGHLASAGSATAYGYMLGLGAAPLAPGAGLLAMT